MSVDFQKLEVADAIQTVPEVRDVKTLKEEARQKRRKEAKEKKEKEKEEYDEHSEIDVEKARKIVKQYNESKNKIRVMCEELLQDLATLRRKRFFTSPDKLMKVRAETQVLGTLIAALKRSRGQVEIDEPVELPSKRKKEKVDEMVDRVAGKLR